MREAVEQLERDAPVIAPGVSERAAKKLRQKARKQVRVSNVTVGLLRNIGALPAPAPVIAPAWQPSSLFQFRCERSNRPAAANRAEETMGGFAMA